MTVGNYPKSNARKFLVPKKQRLCDKLICIYFIILGIKFVKVFSIVLQIKQNKISFIIRQIVQA